MAILNNFVKGLDKRDILHLQALASLILLEKLIEDNEIFSYVKTSKKKMKRPIRCRPKVSESAVSFSLKD